MRYYIGIPFVLLLVLLQTAALPQFRVFDVPLNAVLVAIIAWGLIRSPDEALVLAAVAGLALGMLGGLPAGGYLIALAPAVALTTVRNLHLVHSDFLLALLVAFIGTLLYEGLFLLILGLTGENPDWRGSIRWVIMPAAIANTLLMPLTYLVIRVGSLDRRQRILI